jgi:UDP-2,3-diacylglucosamine pyrophosphatase LpxH
MTTIVVSDVHLGYKKCNKKDFNAFLEYLSKREDINHIVICGDFLDMWRRDLAGVVLENADIFDKLQNLQNKLQNLQKPGMTVDYVAGNHDYHVSKFKNFGYQFAFHDELSLTMDGIKYKFLHGYEFDRGQDKIYFDALCYSTDEVGDIADNAWEIYNRGKSWWRRISGFFKKGKDMRNLKTLLTPPIFGHTHKPFINTKENVANAGSWVKDHTPSNTYLEIKDGKISLKIFGGEDITERLEC